MKIGILVGSLRKESFNRKLAEALINLAPKSIDLQILEIGELPFFNQDLESTPPKAWVKFRESLKPLDGVLFITPEYNRSIPAVLKNAIDVGSRPYGQSIWAKKPAGVISASIGSMGGFGANHHLRQALVFLDMPCMQQPEVYLSFVDKLFSDKGSINSKDTEKFLSQFLENFSNWVKTNKK